MNSNSTIERGAVEREPLAAVADGAVGSKRKTEQGFLMTKKAAATLHIEWTPGWVRAVNSVTGASAEAGTVGELGSVLGGQRHALIGIGRSLVFLKAVRLPKAAPDDLRRILGVQSGQIFPLPAGQLAFDFVQTADVTSEGCLTIVAAVRAEDLAKLRVELKQAGLTPSRILPVALAAPAVASRAGVKDALVVERSPLGVSIDVVQDGSVRFSRTAALDADIEAEAQRTLAAARAGTLPIVATEGVTVPGSFTSSGTCLGLLHEAPAFGFALAEDLANESRKRVASRTRLAVLLTVSAILLATMVWMDRQDALAKVKRDEGQLTAQLTKQKAIQSAAITSASNATAVQSSLKTAFEPGQSLSDVVAVVGDSLPKSVWLTGLTVERGKRLQIRGTAKESGDVATLVNALGANPRFRDVKIVFANSAQIDKTPVVQFNVTAVCVGNLPMPEPQKVVRRAAASTMSMPTEE